MSRGPSRDEIIANQRKLSPHFPTLADALVRRQRQREALAARIMLFATFCGLVYGVWDNFGFVIAGFNLVGFIITCFVSGSREEDRQNKSCGRSV